MPFKPGAYRDTNMNLHIISYINLNVSINDYISV